MSETQGGDAQGPEDYVEADDVEMEESEETPAKPVTNPDLPEDGDPDDFYPEQVPDEDFDDYADNNETMDNKEKLEEPNDLSEIDKEFDDDEDD